MPWTILVTGRQCPGDSLDYRVGLPGELTPGHPQHAVTRKLEVGIPLAVALERAATRMPGEAVDLDDQALLLPQEVDLVAPDPSVGHRAG